MSGTETIEQLLAEREAWHKERSSLERERKDLEQERKDLERERTVLQSENARLRDGRQGDRQEIDRLRRIIASLQHRLFGHGKGEGVDVDQLKLDLAEAEGALEVLEAAEEAADLRAEAARPEPAPKPRRRFVFPEHIEEQTETLIPAEVQADPEAYRQVGEAVTELLDIVPMRFIKKRIVRPRFVRRDDRLAAPVCAPLPPRVLPGGLPGVRLLTEVVLSKYMDHVPLYRQERIYRQRYQVAVSRKTMSDWVRATTQDWLGLIYESIKSDVRRSPYLHVDETPVACMDPDTRGRARNGYLWAYLTPDGEGFYDWHMSRGKAAAEAVLTGYRGLVQCDGYGVYRSLGAKEGFLLVGCLAHVRRKFYEAFEEAGEDAAAWYLLQFKALYKHERLCRDGGYERRAYRLEHSAPLMRELKRRLERDLAAPPPKSAATLQAIQYTLSQWTALERYLHYDEASIDNNPVERALRPTKLGCKNWLFVGHPRAGRRAAILYTLILNCQVHQIDPSAYLADVLGQLPTCSSNPAAIRSLQPKHWKLRQPNP